MYETCLIIIYGTGTHKTNAWGQNQTGRVHYTTELCIIIIICFHLLIGNINGGLKEFEKVCFCEIFRHALQTHDGV